MEVILEGADAGTISEPPKPAGKIHYARSVPLGKAIEGVLLAYEMNGEPLTPAHGFPLARDCARLVRDGGGEMAATDHRDRSALQGYYQTVDYAFWRARCRRSAARADHGDTGESRHRAARHQ